VIILRLFYTLKLSFHFGEGETRNYLLSLHGNYLFSLADYTQGAILYAILLKKPQIAD
jgi:acyl-coenzyme A thioesterase PaaI-like protein